jgi:LDH2 family malate/lactate/ureidoglycolate dehydrogenase
VLPETAPRPYPVEAVRSFVRRVAIAAGLEGDDVELFVTGLVEADLRGIGTHGIYRLPVYTRGFVTGQINPRPELATLRQLGATMVLDGDNGLGVVVGQRAMQKAIDLARVNGVGVVAVQHSNHSGMLAAHVRHAIDQGMIGYFVSNTPAIMAPWGGRDPVLSNSPFAYGIPTSGEAIVLDMACSAVARGRIRLAAQRDEPIPPGWAIDVDGFPAEDAHAAMEGTVLPIGGHKGYGLAFVNEVLAAGLPGASFAFEVPRAFLAENSTVLDSWGVGHLAIALSIEAFMEPEHFRRRIDEYVAAVRASRPANGFAGVLVPGEPEADWRAEHVEHGLPVSDELRSTLDALASELGVANLDAS